MAKPQRLQKAFAVAAALALFLVLVWGLVSWLQRGYHRVGESEPLTWLFGIGAMSGALWLVALALIPVVAAVVLGLPAVVLRILWPKSTASSRLARGTGTSGGPPPLPPLHHPLFVKWRQRK